MTRLMDWADRALGSVNPACVWVGLQAYLWLVAIALAVTIPYHLYTLILWLR